MRTTYALTALAIILTATAAHAGTQVTDAAGGFSYTAPDGWKVTTMAVSKYKISYAKPSGGFAANFVIGVETSSLSLPDYVRASTATLKTSMPGYHFVSQTPFVTKSGLHGFKVVTEAGTQGRKLRQIYFTFPAHGTRKLIVTASVLQAQTTQYAGPIDASMKTFTVK